MENSIFYHPKKPSRVAKKHVRDYYASGGPSLWAPGLRAGNTGPSGTLSKGSAAMQSSVLDTGLGRGVDKI